MKLSIVGLIVCGALVQSCGNSKPKACTEEQQALIGEAAVASGAQLTEDTKEFVVPKAADLDQFTSKLGGSSGACSIEGDEVSGVVSWGMEGSGLKFTFTEDKNGAQAKPAADNPDSPGTEDAAAIMDAADGQTGSDEVVVSESGSLE